MDMTSFFYLVASRAQNFEYHFERQFFLCVFPSESQQKKAFLLSIPFLSFRRQVEDPFVDKLNIS